MQSPLAACFVTICYAGAGGPLLACQVSDYTQGIKPENGSGLRGRIIEFSNAESSSGMF
jgi:hypothetical protein